jgi:hypothetical protein
MNPRASRLLVLLGLVCGTWLLLARFVWLSSKLERGSEALPYGAVAFGAYLLTIGYGVYYRSYWAKPRVVTGREISPLLRWMLTMVVVGAFGLTVGFAFPDILTTFEGYLFMQTVAFAGVGVGLVLTVSSRQTVSADAAPSGAVAGETARAGAASAEAPPTFATSAARVGAWQLYAFVGAALIFGPIYLVMKGFETYVDIPACERTCEARGYDYESLVTGKSTYKCNCQGSDGRHTFHERAHIGGGSGALSAIFDWVIRTGTVLGTMVAWVALLFGAAHFVGGRNPDSVAARAYRACVAFMVPKKPEPVNTNVGKPKKVKNRNRGRG